MLAGYVYFHVFGGVGVSVSATSRGVGCEYVMCKVGMSRSLRGAILRVQQHRSADRNRFFNRHDIKYRPGRRQSNALPVDMSRTTLLSFPANLREMENLVRSVCGTRPHRIALETVAGDGTNIINFNEMVIVPRNLADIILVNNKIDDQSMARETLLKLIEARNKMSYTVSDVTLSTSKCSITTSNVILVHNK